MRYPYEPTRMAKISRTGHIKCWQGGRATGTLTPCWREYKMVPVFSKRVWQFLKKTKLQQWYDPAIPFLGICPREMQGCVHTKTCIQMFALFIIVPNEKKPKCPLMGKEAYCGTSIPWNISQQQKGVTR